MALFKRVKIKAKPEPITREKIEKFLSKDKEIVAREHANNQNILALKEGMLKQCEELLNQLVKYYEVCVKDVTQKNKGDETVITVHHFLDEHYVFDDEINAKMLKLTESQEDFLDSLNRIEIAKKDLDAFSNRKSNLEQEVSLMKDKVTQLNQAYMEVDSLLASCFDGKYGSKGEQKLEIDLDKAVERKQRVQLTHFKWKTAKSLCEHAVTQLEFAINRWQEIGIVPAGQLEKRYTLTTDVRNHLICASQNLTTAQKYLSNVTFPYCTPQEIDTLHSATVHIYSDVQTVFRHAYALQCFSTTHRRAEALVEWFENIISKDMTRDLNATSGEVDELSLDLREERVRVMTRKLKQTTGDEISLADFDTADNNKNMFEDDNEITELSQPHKPSKSTDNNQGKTRRIHVALMNGAENENGFIKADNIENEVDYIQKQHEKDMQIFVKAQRANKARLESGLNEKLQQRRRSKMLQLQELSQALDNTFKDRRVHIKRSVAPDDSDVEESALDNLNLA